MERACDDGGAASIGVLPSFLGNFPEVEGQNAAMVRQLDLDFLVLENKNVS